MLGSRFILDEAPWNEKLEKGSDIIDWVGLGFPK